LQAIDNPGEQFTIGAHLYAIRTRNWLRVVLPSGRVLSYPSPRNEGGKISFMGMNQYSRKWSRISTYGGKLVENFTQAAARDVFKSAYPAVMDAGYEIGMPVHDELVTDTPDEPGYNPEALAALMSRVPQWAPGLPLAAAGFEGYRYRKD
jgi:DNA polymerase